MRDWPSKSSVRKAGSKVREWSRGELSADELQPWIDVIEAHRQRFALPMTGVNMGLRSMLKSQKLDGRVTQRLKRFPTIIKKLSDYESKLDLSRMRDIGGCRVVVASIDEVRKAQSWVERKWELAQPAIDYIETPRRSGYRALHVIVQRDGVPIEVQIRSERMHQWADTVEAFSNVFQINLKHDAEPGRPGGEFELVHDFMRQLSKIDQAIELNQEIPAETVADSNRLAERLRDMIARSKDSIAGTIEGITE